MFGSILEYGKTAAATLGVGSALLAAYTSMGLPLPASQAFVEGKVRTVVDKIDASDTVTARKIDNLAATTLELQRKAIVQQKARLRFETSANGSLLTKADPARRVTLERRSAEIQDELQDLERDDDELRQRIGRLRQP
ncbi:MULTISPECIES: hypothetical protein [Methylobacterium]|nr:MULTISPECIES: hypothetical protein [Methylobacterium]